MILAPFLNYSLGVSLFSALTSLSRPTDLDPGNDARADGGAASS